MKVTIDGTEYAPVVQNCDMQTGTLADLLKQRRDLYAYSLDQACKLLGTSKAHLWDMEQGKSKNPTLRLLKRLSVVYGVSAKQLLELSE